MTLQPISQLKVRYNLHVSLSHFRFEINSYFEMSVGVSVYPNILIELQIKSERSSILLTTYQRVLSV